jgi:hypothetical protein
MKQIKVAAVLASLVLPFGIAFAGDRVTDEVLLIRDFDGNVAFAAGNLGDAFNSKDSNQLIGCSEMPFGTAFCQAQDATDPPTPQSGSSCFTQDPAFIERVRSIHSDSFIAFDLNPFTGECTNLHVSHQSFYRPKAAERERGGGRND